MNLETTIAKLQEAQNDPRKLALATLDIVLAKHDLELRGALEACAIPHWFNPKILAILLDTDETMARKFVEVLRQLPMIEEYTSHNAWNVHEATRLAIRKHLAQNQPDRFRHLSSRATVAFKGDQSHLRMETLYHRLVLEPGEAAHELKRLFEAAGEALPQVLKTSLQELLKEAKLAPVARARALLCLSYSNKRYAHDSEIQKGFKKDLNESIALFHVLHDLASEADARTLLGDVLSVEGNQDHALTEYRAAEQIRIQESQLDPNNISHHYGLAELHKRAGTALAAKKHMEDALQEYAACERILEHLTISEPANVIWQLELNTIRSEITRIQTAQADALEIDAILERFTSS